MDSDLDAFDFLSVESNQQSVRLTFHREGEALPIHISPQDAMRVLRSLDHVRQKFGWPAPVHPLHEQKSN